MDPSTARSWSGISSQRCVLSGSSVIKGLSTELQCHLMASRLFHVQLIKLWEFGTIQLKAFPKWLNLTQRQLRLSPWTTMDHFFFQVLTTECSKSSSSVIESSCSLSQLTTTGSWELNLHLIRDWLLQHPKIRLWNCGMSHRKHASILSKITMLV